MAGRIPEDIVDQIRQASDIVEIIGAYMQLKKRGRNYMALCPFHTEKTASFSVSPDKQIYHCFGCGKGGNVFSFLMEHENMSFTEAVRHLAAKAGIRIPETQVDDARKEELDRLYYAHQVARDYYQMVMKSDKYRTRIDKYLCDNRGLSEDAIEFFQLGLAGESWDGFFNHALKKELYPKELIKAGLVSYSENRDKHFDRFRMRLMIPIFNLSGKVIAFGGRTLRKGEAAKYINSPETVLYNKSNVLYGLNFSRQFIRESNEVLIVEGYFDLISLFQAGLKNVVASSGTAFTATQARLLARFAETAYLFFDADSAGRTAALRSVDALYDAGMEVMVMVSEEGEDPDSLAQAGGLKAITEVKQKALRYLDFRIKDIDLEKQGIIAKEKLIKELAEVAGRINDITRRELFIGEAAERLKVDPHTFYNLIPSQIQPSDKPPDTRAPRKITDFEQDLISLILNFPDYVDIALEKLSPDDFQDKSLAGIFEIINREYHTRGRFSVDRLIDKIDDVSEVSKITQLANTDWNGSRISQIMNDYVEKILSFKNEREIDELKAKLKLAEKNGDTETADELIGRIADLINRRK
jgi:DNA primase